MKYSHRKEAPPEILKKFDKRAWTLNYGIGIDGNGDGIPDVDTTPIGGEEVIPRSGSMSWTRLSRPREDWSSIPSSSPFFVPQNAWGRPLFDFTERSDDHDRVDSNGDFVYHVPQHLHLIDRTPNSGKPKGGD